ncbi:hypothetical protein Pcinc_026717 [Petrolisthes cinctipes]|uniref:Uncharacterized protein n=1 Tax=Petrolisthes cinctipes TaxID=88211 RepID=A0AAE1K9W0_PETCI|nr:hypothetical protein Pcinc_026717 [Petrolisthes cinctipes]
MTLPTSPPPPSPTPSAATLTGAETTVVAAVPAVVVVPASSDLTSAATSGHGAGGGGGKQGGGKFFMYAHQPSKKEYEFGFKRGNNYHTIERYEKAGPQHNFKTKVRWEDSKGGHGEHYWDYNHAPKYKDHGGYHSQPVPDYAPAASANTATASAPDTQPQPSPTYRHRKQPRTNNKNNNKDEVKKAEEQDRKKKYQYYNEKQTFEYQMSTSDPHLQHEAQQESPSTFPHLQQESPSTFPHLLGYNPYLPPEIAKEPFFTQDAASAFSTGSSTLSPKRVTPRTTASIPRPPPQVSAATVSEPQYSRFDPQYTATTTSTGTTATSPFGRRHARVGPSATKRTLKNGQDVKTKAVATTTTTTTTSPLPPLNPSGLSFDAETGHVYNEGTGVWYSLVPMKQA